VTESRASLDGLLDPAGGNPAFTGLGEQDRLSGAGHPAVGTAAFAGDRCVHRRLVDNPLPEGAKALRQVLRVGAAQILFLDVP
jgi:16S rRNA (cytosine967-C5)-methyltransferase